MEIGQFKIIVPKIQEWKSSSYCYSSAPLPETPSANNFYTNENGSQVVFYLTPGNHDRMWADIDLFSKCESSSQWQQFLSRAYVQFGQYRALRVFTTTGPDIFQAQYFLKWIQQLCSHQCVRLETMNPFQKRCLTIYFPVFI